MAQDVVTERRGAALWLRLNRPDRLNGLSPDVVEGIDAGLDAAEADDEVRAVVLAAEGRLFCAGADLKYIGSLYVHAEDFREGLDAFNAKRRPRFSGR